LPLDAHHLKSDAARYGVHLRSPADRYQFDIFPAKEGMTKVISRQLPWLILVFGGLISSWAAWNINAQIEREARTNFQMHSLDFQTSVASRLRSYEDILFGVAGLYHHSDKEVTPEEFEAYAQSLDLDTRFPALDDLNYAKYFGASEREKFLAEFRKGFASNPDNANNVAALNLGPGSNEYMVITRNYPSGVTNLGFNLMTVLQRLSKEGFPPLSSDLYRPNAPVSSGMPILARGRTSASLGVRLGIFNPGNAQGSRLAGTVGIIFNVEEFFKEALPATLADRIAYRVENIGRFGSKTSAQPIPIFSSSLGGNLPKSIAADPANVMTTSFTVPFGGALFRVEMSEAKSLLVGGRDEALPFAVLAGGLLFFGMASVLSRRTLERNRELTHAITAQTADLQREIDRAKQLERELAHVIEEERRRIGYELHDDLGQRLTGMSLSFKALSETLQSVSADLSAQAEALERTTSEAIVSVRGLAHGLMPVPAGYGGLGVALEQLAASVSSRHTVRCIFDFDDPVDIENDTVATNLYRIAQEAVNNALRHSRATAVKIRLDDEYGKVTLTVKDNGIGFPHDRRAADTRPVQIAGAGLRIMAYRASVINYTLTVDSSFADGTTIKAQAC
jgi:signal transduction histidine kinase